MLIKEIKCKSLLNKSKLADYCINCYVGCQHACKYCYAAYYTYKYTQHKEEWGKFLDVKINADEVLRNEIATKKKGSVFISSLTDPYQPIEKKYELTRKCLEVLLKGDFSVCIQTKSSLILRDLDLLKNFKECEVGITIITVDDEIRNVFEPFSSPTEERLEALKVLKENGIKNYVFFGPVLPYFSDQNLEEYFKKTSKFTDCFYVDKLNIKPGTWHTIEVAIKSFPEKLEDWRKVLLQSKNYYRELKEKIRKIAAKNSLKVVFCY